MGRTLLMRELPEVGVTGPTSHQNLALRWTRSSAVDQMQVEESGSPLRIQTAFESRLSSIILERIVEERQWHTRK
jgi:hypothetical protein